MHPRASQPSVATVGLGWMRAAGGSAEVDLRPGIAGDLLGPSAGAIIPGLWTESPSTGPFRRASQRNELLPFSVTVSPAYAPGGSVLSPGTCWWRGRQCGCLPPCTFTDRDTRDRVPAPCKSPTHFSFLTTLFREHLCQPLRAALTRNHKLNDSEHASFWRPEVQSQFYCLESRCQQVWLLL